MNLASMIERSINETIEECNVAHSSPSPDIDHNAMIEEDGDNFSSREVVDTDIISNTFDVNSLIYESINFETFLNRTNNLQFTTKIDLTNISDISDNGIVILKSTEENNNNIQIYKHMNDYMVFDKSTDYMKLFGENGFVIKYESDGDYHWKIYGTKSNLCTVLFVDSNDHSYPIWFDKFRRNKNIEVNLDNLIISDPETIERSIDDDSTFDAEDCCIYYTPFYQKMEMLTSKRIVINTLHDILNKTIDVAHSIKVINAMINLI